MVVTSSVVKPVASQLDRTASAEPDGSRLIAAAKGGDTLAYAQLLRRHQAVAFRAASLIAGSAAEAEDATQEACVKAWLALERFRPTAPFRPWLVQIAINEARNGRRAAGRRAGLALRVGGGRDARERGAGPSRGRGGGAGRGRPARDRRALLHRPLGGRTGTRPGAAART